MSASVRREAEVLGVGPVGLTCAMLLERGGWRVRLVGGGPRHSRPIAVAAHTAAMLADLWDVEFVHAFPAYELTSRCVAWSAAEAAQEVDSPAFSVDFAGLCSVLEARLGTRCAIEYADDRQPSGRHFTIDARGAPPSGACRVVAGKRRMWLWNKVPADPCLTKRSEMLSGPGFWIFLLPTGETSISVQIATPGAPPDLNGVEATISNAAPRTLAYGLARHLSDLRGLSAATALIAPRLGAESDAYLTAGDRAMTFDPICGDGLGQGIRSAMLAVAGLRACADGMPADRVRNHVATRYRFAFASHLKHCVGYYGAIADSMPWQTEITSMGSAIAALPARSAPANSDYRLLFDARLDRSPYLQALSGGSVA